MQERSLPSTQTSTTSTGTNTSMESADSVDIDDPSVMPQSRGRNSNNSKLKVLVRSHAMREETSPPREPIGGQQQQQQTPPVSSPCIKLTPSSDSHPSSPTRSVLVLSPASGGRLSRSASPTSTLVATPSPTHAEFVLPNNAEYGAIMPEPNRINNKTNKQHVRKKNYHATQQHQQQQQQHDAVVDDKRGNGVPNKCECLNNNNNMHNNNNNTLTVSSRGGGGNGGGSGGNGRGKLRQQSSSLGSFDGSTPSLSRDNSSEQYTDTTGVDLEQFIPETLNRNAKDRILMLRIEEELVQLAKDKGKTHFKFPPMSSYQRMLVHRCAAYFGMDHNIESSGKCVVVNKTKNTRIPDVEFKAHIKDEYTEEPRRSILKRDSNSIEDYNFKSPDRQYSFESRRSKSFEEREEEYEKARRRIFNKGSRDCSTDDLGWAEELSWSNSEHEMKYRLHNDHHHHHRSSRLLKVQSEDPGEETLRPYVAKSYSFGGYGGALTRGDSIMSTHSAGPRLFTKQDSSASSVSWRLSPSSSGYKTQSQRSESITPSPTSTPFFSNDCSSNRQDSTATNASDIPAIQRDDDDNQQVVWAVTNIQNVPKGSVLINPQTGQPMKNDDGSVYHHDPAHPLPDLEIKTECKADDRKPTVNNSNGSHVPPTAAVAANTMTTAKPPMSPAKGGNNGIKKERPASPKKRTSPIKKTNSATSPILPYTPPLAINSLPSMPNLSAIAAVPAPPLPVAAQLVHSKSFPGGYADAPNQTSLLQTPNQYYGATYDYAQPCIVYATTAAPPYGQLPVAYDPRIEATQLTELPQTYYVDTTNSGIAYQPQPTPTNVWPPTQYVYSNGTQPRYAALQVPQPPQQQGAFIAPYGAQAGYIPQPPTGNAPNGTGEMMTVYQQQPLLYPAPTSNVYTNPNMIYAQPPPGTAFANTVFTAPPLPPQQPHATAGAYPVNAPTPNGGLYPMEQLVQGVAQMHVHSPPVLAGGKDGERRIGTPKCNKVKGLNLTMSQCSTEASSPATTVMAYTGAMYHRQNSETPPSIPTTPSFGGSFPPTFIRQMSNVRASPPVQNRASRSPTPVTPTMPGEMMALGGEHARPRYPMPPFLYQAMPYSIPSDSRLASSRGPPNAYRQQSPRPQHHQHQQQQYQHHQPPSSIYPHANNTNSNPIANNASAYVGVVAATHHFNQTAVDSVNKFRNRKPRNSKPTYSQYNNKKPSSN